MAEHPPFMAQLAAFADGVNKGTYAQPDLGRSHLTPDLYTDEARFEREWETVFKTAPIIIGHASMIPKPGDHFTFDALGLPLLVSRGRDDKIRVFLNVCRHRGVRLVNQEGVTRKPSFVCPYHNWTYGPDGHLISVPCEETFTHDDVTDRHLKTVPSAVANGFIYVRASGSDAIDTSNFLGELETDLDALNLSDQVFFDQSVRVKKANWKLIVEAFQDGYHVVRLHRKTVARNFLDNVADIVRVKDHLRAMVARTEFDAMRQKPMEDWDVRNDVSLAFYLYPNTIIIIHPDYISHLGLFPTAPDETICIHRCFLDEHPKSDKAQAHFQRAFDIIDKGVFDAEDFFVCEQAQIGMASGANDYFPLSDHEIGLQLFHQILDEKLSA